MAKRKGAGQNKGLRIVAGTARGRRLKIPSGEDVRPTLDRIRESLFNILGHDLPGCVVLDLFAGSGALGIEALSRGAEYALFIDNRQACTQAIQENLQQCRLMEKAKVLKVDIPSGFPAVKRTLPRQFDLVCLDPPYRQWEKQGLLEQLDQFSLLKKDARIVFEHFYKDDFQAVPQGFQMEDQRRYGDVVLSFFRFASHDGDGK